MTVGAHRWRRMLPGKGSRMTRWYHQWSCGRRCRRKRSRLSSGARSVIQRWNLGLGNERRRHRLPRRYVLFRCLAGWTRGLGHRRRCGGWLVGWSARPHHLLRWVFALLGRRGWGLGEDLCCDVGLLRCRCAGTSSTRHWRRERQRFQALPR
jgi:hypothetical protein